MFWRCMWLALAMLACAMMGWTIYTVTHPSQVPCNETAAGCGLLRTPDWRPPMRIYFQDKGLFGKEALEQIIYTILVV